MFDKIKFLPDLKNTNISFTSADANENYLFLMSSFSKIFVKHVPQKKKTREKIMCLLHIKN